LKIKFLGSGNAFTIPERDNNFQSNVIITNGNKNLLIDAGDQIGSSLYYHGYDVSDIDAIFLTHNHPDHNLGLNYIGYKTYFNPDLEKLVLFGDPKVLDVLWNNVLSGNMSSLVGQRAEGITTYFDGCKVPPKGSFKLGDIDYMPVRVPHVIDDYDEVPAYGLKWQYEGVHFFFSGDTMFDFWRLMPFWEYGDIIFQECEFLEYDNSVHSQFRHLVSIPDKYKKKMWLYHYSLNGKTFEELEKEVLEQGFQGLVKKGQEFKIEKGN